MYGKVYKVYGKVLQSLWKCTVCIKLYGKVYKVYGKVYKVMVSVQSLW